MTRAIYWLCFGLVLLSVLLSLSVLLAYLVDKNSSNFLASLLVVSFFSLIPPMLSGIVPGLVQLALNGFMLFLLIRRIWLIFSKKERVPSSFQGFPKLLGYIGALSVAVSAAAFALTIALRAGSGVPAALLMLPALVCIPWAFFLAEVINMRRPAQA